jgi:Xaa-Pro aminopeptidase
MMSGSRDANLPVGDAEFPLYDYCRAITKRIRGRIREEFYMTFDFERRRQKLVRQLKQKNITSFLVSHCPNVTYLTGFTGDSTYLLVHQGKFLLLSDPRYEEQIQEECVGLDVSIRTPDTTLLEATAAEVLKAKCNLLFVESNYIPLYGYEILRSLLPKCELVGCTGEVESLREVKDREEISRIERAIRMAERAFQVMRPGLRADLTERQVAHQLENEIRALGGIGCSFPPIVGVGPRAALPHGTPTDVKIGSGPFVLIDWGAREGLYISDLTRVLVTSKIPPKFEKVYRLVLEANEAAIRTIRPGIAACEVDRAAREVIEKGGFGKQFGHALGHGIGLQVHESPRMGLEQKRPLVAGMVVTVEPGIYIPGWGGIRIEDDVLVTKEGCQVLSSLPKDLDSTITECW